MNKTKPIKILAILPTLLTVMLCILPALPSSMLNAEEPQSKKLRVVTSFLPIQSHTTAIAGDMAQVEQLLDKEAGPHDFQLTPSSVRKLAEADLFIINGAGIEDWLDELIKKAGNKNLVIVDTSKGIRLLDNPEEILTDAGDHRAHDHKHHDHGHDHSHADGKNPHTWLDPVIALKQAEIISKALQKADSSNASIYQANTKAYIAELKKLDADFASALAPLPNKNLVTFHEAFPYLAERYELNYVGAISKFPEKDPSPKQLAALVDKIKELRIGVLFCEEAYAPELLKKIAGQTGAKVSTLNTLEVGQGNATAYISLMRANLVALRAAFTVES
ncbi:MAG: zinc ABC transporter substrate-binding protein [Verrucomicrobiota bacterium]